MPRTRDLNLGIAEARRDHWDSVYTTKPESQTSWYRPHLDESLRLIDVILDSLPQGEIITALPALREFKPALGCVEGWRGPVWVALESGPADTIRRCHPHDPSLQNWPVIEHAVIGNIVPDFPLINKSFNLSYSGHDL